jgi:putative oxidoreductase
VKFFILIARLFIGAMFIYASVHKILDPGDFAVSIRNYLIIPPAWSNMVALTLPWVEFGAGALLILGIQTRPSALLTTGMLAVFLAAIIRAYAIGLDIDCGCFSSGTGSVGQIGVYHIVRDSTFVCVSALVLLFDRGELGIASIPVFRRFLGWANA